MQNALCELGANNLVTPPVPSPTIQNIVATIHMGALHPRFHEVLESFPFADYNSTRFAAAIIKLRSPAATCSVFVSGKAVITGAKTEITARHAATRLVVLLRRLGLGVSYNDFRIRNIVTAVYCPFYLDLRSLYTRLGGSARYNPTIFPGLAYKCFVPNRVSVLFFASGKCVISGCKTRSQSAEVWENVYRDHVVHCQSTTRFSKNCRQEVDWRKIATLVTQRLSDTNVSECMRAISEADDRLHATIELAAKNIHI